MILFLLIIIAAHSWLLHRCVTEFSPSDKYGNFNIILNAGAIMCHLVKIASILIAGGAK